jgi:hypothetical protein
LDSEDTENLAMYQEYLCYDSSVGRVWISTAAGLTR